MTRKRTSYPSDVGDEEWAFVAPYLTLLPEEAGQRMHSLRAVFTALRWIVRTGSPWRYLPNDLPRRELVYQQTQRWIAAGCIEAMVHDLRALLRIKQGRADEPTAVVIDSRTLRSTPGERRAGGLRRAQAEEGFQGACGGGHAGHLLALHVTLANEQDRAQVEVLAAAVQEITGETVTLAYVDQRYTGQQPAAAADIHGIELEVVKHTEAKRGFGCCRGTGWSSAASHGRRVSAGWSRTTNGSRRPSPACTSSPSPSCSSAESQKA